MTDWLKNKWKKFLNGFLDVLLFVVPLLEVSEMVALIPQEYLPLYMLAALILRRLVRVLEERMEKKDADLADDKRE
jgi:hypothetical protein